MRHGPSQDKIRFWTFAVLPAKDRMVSVRASSEATAEQKALDKLERQDRTAGRTGRVEYEIQFERVERPPVRTLR